MISMKKMIEANKSYGEAEMKCSRCHREMVYEKFHALHECFWGWRCIFCGEIIDPVIWENRNLSRHP
jgi:hypothetical protein